MWDSNQKETIKMSNMANAKEIISNILLRKSRKIQFQYMTQIEPFKKKT